MPLIRRTRRRIAPLIVPSVGACLVVYFAYYTIAGGRGLNALTKLQGKVAVAEAELDTLKTQRLGLEKQVVSLRPGSIDPDLLDERARVVLNYSKPNEVVIFPDSK